MSLIEQAAQRLRELQAAGAELPDTLSGNADKVQKDTTPTPEAFVRALEALPPGTAQDLAVAGPPAVHSRVARAPPRHVDINLAALAMRGYVTPEAATSQTADEFRVIKRPIIRNAIGPGGANGKIRNLVMITSALPAEGKTFTALNLAMSVAMEFDSTVLLVDGDVAHPSLPALLGVPNSPGLLDLLTRDDLDVADVLIRTNVEKLTVGDPLDPETDVGPLITPGDRDRVKGWVDEAVAAGAELLTGGELVDEGRCLAPTLLASPPRDAKVWCEEIFGPVATIDRYSDFEQALEMANDSKFGLQAGVFTRDMGRGLRAAEALEFGGVLINEVPTFRADQQPYGGVKDSGNTREGPAFAVMELTEERFITLQG